jgi:hypothetical protein
MAVKGGQEIGTTRPEVVGYEIVEDIYVVMEPVIIGVFS